MLACRACRIPMTAEHGCAICEDVRKHLVSTDEDDCENPSLASVSGETVAALRTQLKTVRALLKDAPHDGPAASQLIAVANSVAKVVEAARKLQADGLSVLQNMGFLEKAELFITWYAELAPAYRAGLRKSLDKHELEIATPAKALPA